MEILKKALLSLLLFIVSEFAFSQDTALFMSYNLLNYYSSTQDSTVRNPYFRTIIQHTHPDVLAAVEVVNNISSSEFLKNVLQKVDASYTRAPFSGNAYDTNSSLYYLSSQFSCNSNVAIHTSTSREINDYTLIHKATGKKIHVYVVHLKASSGSDNEQKRLSEADSLRAVTDALPANTSFIVCGDFNFYGSTPAYIKLTESHTGTQGQFFDALDMPGIWDSPAYTKYHTQSTRRRSFGYGYTGSTGGLDDRFDLFLFSKDIVSNGSIHFVEGSTKVIGNDGNHYNDSINQLPNTAVSVAVANALHYASDHLPVQIKLVYGKTSSIRDISASSNTFIVYPNPSDNECFIKSNSIESFDYLLYDLTGRILNEGTGFKSVIVPLEGLSKGIYYLKISSEKESEVFKLAHY